MRRLESEPITRGVTPVDVPRMHSVPLKKRKVFDGVQVPTLREILRRKAVQRAEMRTDTINARVSVPRTPSPRSTRSKSGTPQSVLAPSDEDELDWENFYVDGVSSGESH